MKKALVAIVAIVVLAVIGTGVAQWMRTSQDNPLQGAMDGQRAPGEPPAPAEPDWCPAVEFISAPGTWESSANDDPFNPQANPLSFMLSISQPLQNSYDINDVRVWTLPYTAQFKNINANHELSYDESRDEGTAKVNAELKFIHETCPSTDFILAGFSQGAVLLGDIANEIGNGHGAIPEDKVRGVALIADGRRQNGVGMNPGVDVAGIGAEIALQPVNALVQFVTPGATMRGPRDGGFGSLNDRVQEICSPGDAVCDAPLDAGNGIERAQELIAANGIHAQYASNQNVIPGTTTNQWVVDWAHNLINNHG
ncbi:cutinase family protein [Corynebacterium tapiri]|uniref:Cutinase family protein n=1 Tax=Corynebacterium tapiri TaxID=1448266 RepID=A0A5C4U3K3_9CORY|nr:cutinase family protein [Corynebacterium tapiri]TNL95582.1 cutinase family protein [Corynebacterium tapiri]